MSATPDPNRPRKWRQKYNSRKFILACAIILGSGFLLWFGKLDPGSFTAIVISTSGLYFASNNVESEIQRRAKAGEVPTVKPGGS
jgi:hypothetical protein